jgi:hypothetical protein
MALLEDLMGLGLPDQLANIVANESPTSASIRSVATALTATGTTIANALQLTAFVSVLSTVAASTGVKLASEWPVGQIGFVQNNGANALNIFPPTASIKINGGSAGAAVTTAAAAGALIVRLASDDFGVYVIAKEA